MIRSGVDCDIITLDALAHQPYPVSVAHPQQQAQVAILRRRQGSLPGVHPALVWPLDYADPVISQYTCKDGDELNLGKLRPGAVLWAVGPWEVSTPWRGYD